MEPMPRRKRRKRAGRLAEPVRGGEIHAEALATKREGANDTSTLNDVPAAKLAKVCEGDGNRTDRAEGPILVHTTEENLRKGLTDIAGILRHAPIPAHGMRAMEGIDERGKARVRWRLGRRHRAA